MSMDLGEGVVFDSGETAYYKLGCGGISKIEIIFTHNACKLTVSSVLVDSEICSCVYGTFDTAARYVMGLPYGVIYALKIDKIKNVVGVGVMTGGEASFFYCIAE